MRISETARSNSVCDTLGKNSFHLDDPGHGDDLVPTYDERPRLAGRTGDLRVDEHVLDLLRSPGEPIAGAPGSYLKAWEARGNPPFAPVHLRVEHHWCSLEPDALVLPHSRQPATEVEPLRAGGRGGQLVERGWVSLPQSQLVEVGTPAELAWP